MNNSRRYFSVPNLLSGSRVLLGGLLFWSICNGRWYVAATLFWVAIVTDLADGFLARKFNLTSPLGGLLDHGSDAFFVTCGLAGLAVHGWAPLFLAALVPVAFIQYVLDSKALTGKPLRSSQLGRYNGISYFVLTGFPIMQLTLGVTLMPYHLFIWGGWGLVLTTLMSMIDRLVTLMKTPR